MRYFQTVGLGIARELKEGTRNGLGLSVRFFAKNGHAHNALARTCLNLNQYKKPSCCLCAYLLTTYQASVGLQTAKLLAIDVDAARDIPSD